MEKNSKKNSNTHMRISARSGKCQEFFCRILGWIGFFCKIFLSGNVKILVALRNFLQKIYWLDWHKISICTALLYNVQHELLWASPDVLVLARRCPNHQENVFFLNDVEKNSRKNSNTNQLGTALKGTYEVFFHNFRWNIFFKTNYFLWKINNKAIQH